MQSQTIAERFRSAVSAGAFFRAEELLETYRSEVEASWKAATSAAERRAIATEVSAVLEWARRATLSAQAHDQRKLILLRREAAYAPNMRQNESLNLNA